MIILYISFIGCYKKSFNLSPGLKQELPSYFHFQSNGEYLIDVDTSNQKYFPINVDIFICTKSEFKKFNEQKNRYCAKNYNLLIESHENISKVSGTIEKRGPYKIILFSTKSSSVSITLRNPKSYLDYYLQPCLYIEPIFLSIFVVFMILWIINTVQYSLYNFSICEINFHKILTCNFIIIIFTSIFRICSLWKIHLHNQYKPYDKIEFIFKIIENTIIFYSIFLSASGMSIANDKMDFFDNLIIFIQSLSISLPSLFTYEEDPTISDYFYVVVYFLLYLSVFMSFRNIIKNSKRKLAAHLYIINEEGIDPKTTPIYEKFLLFEKISFYLMNFFWFSIIIIFCFLNFSRVYALNTILIDLIILAFAFPLAWFYRYRKEMKRGYMKFDEFEFKREPKTILKETVEMINLSTFQINGRENNNNAEKEIWTDGMPLPPCPKIVNRLNDTENENYHLNQNNDADKKNDENIENNSDNEDDHLVTQINLESMNDLKI